MSTRSNIRPRPVDTNKQLLTVKDVAELDSVDLQAAEAVGQGGHGHGHGHGHGSAGANKKPKAIPIPDIREVETHYRDYLPLFSQPITYLHGKGVGGAREPDPIEYDLDNEDEDWLKQYNLGRNKLNDMLFEKMLWKLELACAEATDSALTAAGAGPSERTAASAVAAIDHLPKQEAVRMLALECGGREKLINDVYSYWAGKRKRWGKPILRRLQAPTIASDTNPYNTFRTREKVNRPQTRRRRDNSDELMDKMRLLKENLMEARAILDEIVRRERRKRDLACTDIELLRIQWRQHHEGSTISFDQISQEGLQMLRERIKHNGNQDSIRGGSRFLANKTQLHQHIQPSKRPRRDSVLRHLRMSVSHLPQPIPCPEPEHLWSLPANVLQIPLESKGKQRDRMDDIRRGRPVMPPSAAAAAAEGQSDQVVTAGSAAAAEASASVKTEPGNADSGTAAAAAPAAAGVKSEDLPSPSGQGATDSATANGDASTGKATSPSGTANAADGADASKSTAGAAQDQGAAAAAPGAGLPPAGPSAPNKLTAVMAALNERRHLFKLPEAIANNIQSWRCFIGRGGRARLECIDHVTHESLHVHRAEAQAIQQYYQTEPWPPMPTAPNLRELVDKYKPPTRQGMARSASLASQPSASGVSLQGGFATSTGTLGQPTSHRQRYMQQQYPTPQMAAAAAAAAAAGGGIAAAVQQQQPQQQHVVQQAQQAHKAGIQVQPSLGGGMDQQQAAMAAAMQQQVTGGLAAAGGLAGNSGSAAPTTGAQQVKQEGAEAGGTAAGFA